MSWTRPKSSWDLFLKMLSPTKGDRILDVGAGKGQVARQIMAASEGLEVFALEPDEKRVATMKRESPQLKSYAGASEKMPFEDSFFDKAYTTMALHHFTNLNAALLESARVLKNGGLLLILDVEPSRGSGRLLRFFENTILRNHLEFLGLEEIGQRIVATGRFEISGSSRGPFGYIVLCTKKAP
ncbi:MAG: class I SAM-dependent methyltransferase [Thaumarchaeota archaeon]|nr:class I SAM-dependent methyltransferase [Nitrososphaerota archaeon]